MEKPGDKTAAQLEAEDTARWIKEHEDSLDYSDVPDGDRDYKYDDSELSPETQKAFAEREAQLAKQSD